MVSVERDESYDALPRVIRARNVETALKYRIQETIYIGIDQIFRPLLQKLFFCTKGWCTKNQHQNSVKDYSEFSGWTTHLTVGDALRPDIIKWVMEIKLSQFIISCHHLQFDKDEKAAATKFAMLTFPQFYLTWVLNLFNS